MQSLQSKWLLTIIPDAAIKTEKASTWQGNLVELDPKLRMESQWFLRDDSKFTPYCITSFIFMSAERQENKQTNKQKPSKLVCLLVCFKFKYNRSCRILKKSFQSQYFLKKNFSGSGFLKLEFLFLLLSWVHRKEIAMQKWLSQSARSVLQGQLMRDSVYSPIYFQNLPYCCVNVYH